MIVGGLWGLDFNFFFIYYTKGNKLKKINSISREFKLENFIFLLI